MPSPRIPDFHARFRRLRGPLTQREVSVRLDMTTTSIQLWESGTNQPSLETIMKIAQAADVSLDYLTGLTDEWRDPSWWATRDGDEAAPEARTPPAPGPDAPSSDLDSMTAKRRQGDERRARRSSRRQA